MDNDLFEKFKVYHTKNPQVWNLFCGYTEKVEAAGYVNYSAKAVFERIRWHMNVDTRDDKFKLNNNYTAYYARMYNYLYAGRKFYREREQGTPLTQEQIDWMEIAELERVTT